MKRRMPRRQSPFASLVPPPTEWPSAALRPPLHQPIAIAEPRFPPVLVARESRAIAAGAEPKFHFLGRAQRQPLRAVLSILLPLPPRRRTPDRADGLQIET